MVVDNEFMRPQCFQWWPLKLKQAQSHKSIIFRESVTCQSQMINHLFISKQCLELL